MENPAFEEIRRLVATGRAIIVPDFTNLEMRIRTHLENINDDIQMLFE
jgi:hypothetical protein